MPNVYIFYAQKVVPISRIFAIGKNPTSWIKHMILFWHNLCKYQRKSLIIAIFTQVKVFK